MKKFKNKFKRSLIPLFIALAITLSLFSISAFAAEDEVIADPPDASDSKLDSTEVEAKPSGESDPEGELGSDNTDTEGDISASEGDSEEGDDSDTFIYSLFKDFKDNLSEILSALSLLCSVILMIVYKSGFIPMVKDGVSALSARVKAIGVEADKMASDASGMNASIRDALAVGEKRLGDMDTAISTLSERLYGVEAIGEKSDSITKALSLEAEMLYELFMSSALPQYEKDRVGEKIAEMRLLLNGGKK